MNTGGDQWWVSHNCPELLAKRGYSAAAVRAARRFFNGEMEVGEYYSTFVKFMRAYYYRMNLLKLAYEVVTGPQTKFRPEATIYGYTQLLQGWTVMDRLNEIKVPTLVMAGRHDFLFPPEHQAILADRLPNSDLALIERAGHNPHMEQTPVVMKALRDFMVRAQHFSPTNN
jgi:proline iminopeptidase